MWLHSLGIDWQTHGKGKISHQNYVLYLNTNKLFPQVKSCDPMDQLCVERVSEEEGQIVCETSCSGLHADVTNTDDDSVHYQFLKQQTNLKRGKL